MENFNQLSMELSRLLSLAAAIVLSLVHLSAGRLEFLERIRRRGWLSFGSGISVAYVFLHLLPDLGERQGELLRSNLPAFVAVKDEVYLIALTGMLTFYGLERAMRAAEGVAATEEASHNSGMFWLHAASFAAYNATIGYLLVERAGNTLPGLLLFSVAMVLHFVTNDMGLRRQHRERYDASARWLLAGACLLGWVIGLATEVPEHFIAVPTAFLAGGVVLNVFKEELPPERDGAFVPFLIGVGVYAAILLSL